MNKIKLNILVFIFINILGILSLTEAIFYFTYYSNKYVFSFITFIDILILGFYIIYLCLSIVILITDYEDYKDLYPYSEYRFSPTVYGIVYNHLLKKSILEAEKEKQEYNEKQQKRESDIKLKEFMKKL